MAPRWYPPAVWDSGKRVSGASSGFGVQGVGFRVQGSGFRVRGSRFRVQGSRFRVQGAGRRVKDACARLLMTPRLTGVPRS